MKQYLLQFSPSSLKDIEKTVNYYNEQSWGLGNKFLLDAEIVFRSIGRNPFFASVKYDDVRFAALKKFPFSVHFTIDKKEQAVTIIAILNNWKEPFW